MALTGIPLDTSLEALRVQAEVLARLSPAERVRQMFRLCEQTRAIMESGIRHRHPDYTDEQVRLAGIRMSLGDELFREVYPGIDVAP